MKISRFRRLAGVVIANIPEIDSGLASDFEANGDALAIVLKGALTRENLDAALVALGKPPKPLIAELDTDALPRLPTGWNLTDKDTKHRGMGKVTVEKRSDGQLYVNGAKVVRYLSPNQKSGEVIGGYELRLELEKPGEPSCLNVTFRNWLFAHPEFIPGDWDTGTTYFWDTVAADSESDLCVAYLCRIDWRWFGGWAWLARDWHSDSPAARLETEALGN